MSGDVDDNPIARERALHAKCRDILYVAESARDEAFASLNAIELAISMFEHDVVLVDKTKVYYDEVKTLFERVRDLSKRARDRASNVRASMDENV